MGRTASAATDPTFKAEVYSYSRSRGVFAGLALDGTVISIDDDANERFYKKPDVAAGDILNGSVTTDDDSAQRFMAAVATSTGTQRYRLRRAAARPGGDARPATRRHPRAGQAPRPRPRAQTFPLADPQPGQEPK